MSEEQAVVEATDPGATPPVEEASAQDELDSLLSEFPTEPEPTPAAPAEVNKLDEVHADIQDMKRKESLRVTNERIAGSVAAFKETAGADISDDLAETLLHGAAAKDPRIAQAFMDAGNNPQAWNKVVKSLAKKFTATAQASPDPDATADKNSLVAAVRSASTKTPVAKEAKAVNEMTDAEFHKAQRDLGIAP